MYFTNLGFSFFFVIIYLVKVKSIEKTEDRDSYDQSDKEDSGERLGPAVTQIDRHPYAGSLLRHNQYCCSASILNPYWLLTLSKCFEEGVIASYITRAQLSNYTVRVGSSYNGKGGSIYNIKQLTNNFDMKISVVKLTVPLEFSTKIAAIKLPSPDESVAMGDLAQIIAWTPNGHIRVVNAPVLSSSLCLSHSTFLPGHYVCLGGVQDPNRHFCRRDNGGAVVQNNQLIGISTFILTCAHYTKSHAFPKVSFLSRWLETVIWDENNRPTTTEMTEKATANKPVSTPSSTTEGLDPTDSSGFSVFTLPFDPINVPLEPAQDNSVIPRMSVYESYLHNMVHFKLTTSKAPPPLTKKGPPATYDRRRKAWIQKVNEAMMRMAPPNYAARKLDHDYDYE